MDIETNVIIARYYFLRDISSTVNMFSLYGKLLLFVVNILSCAI